jgi:hypothetical protein
MYAHEDVYLGMELAPGGGVRGQMCGKSHKGVLSFVCMPLSSSRAPDSATPTTKEECAAEGIIILPADKIHHHHLTFIRDRLSMNHIIIFFSISFCTLQTRTVSRKTDKTFIDAVEPF